MPSLPHTNAGWSNEGGHAFLSDSKVFKLMSAECPRWPPVARWARRESKLSAGWISLSLSLSLSLSIIHNIKLPASATVKCIIYYFTRTLLLPLLRRLMFSPLYISFLVCMCVCKQDHPLGSGRQYGSGKNSVFRRIQYLFKKNSLMSQKIIY